MDPQPPPPPGSRPPAPIRSSPAEEALRTTECAEARELLSRFVDRGLTRAADRRFRVHLTDCPTCRGVYRETLASAARLGRALRSAREEEERRRRRLDNRERALRAGSRPGRGRYHGLKLALLPAAMVLLFTMLTRLGDEGLEVRVAPGSRGEVRAAGVALGIDAETVSMEGGTWCATGAGGRAALEGPTGRIALDERSQLLVEDPEEGRVRLQSGGAELDGRWCVTFQYGVALLDGRARVAREADGFRLECLDGDLSLLGPHGSHAVLPGEWILAGRDAPSRPD